MVFCCAQIVKTFISTFSYMIGTGGLDRKVGQVLVVRGEMSNGCPMDVHMDKWIGYNRDKPGQ